MPPKAQATARRGRPERTAAPAPTPATEPAPVANASKKRGRAAKTQEGDEAVAVEPPKKRGRQAKAQVEEAVVVEEAPKRGRRSNVAPTDAPVEEATPATKKRMGRPPKKETAAAAAAPAEDAPAPKKRMGRPPKKATAPVDAPAATSKARSGRPTKNDAVAAEDVATPKRRGRNSAAAVHLSRVAGSSRVTKPRSKAAPKVIVPPRLDPRMRSKLRTRQPATANVKQEVAPAPTKRRGRPPKAEPAQVVAAKQTAGRKSGPQKAAAKAVAPRKKRGVTTLDIPDKYAAQMKQYLEDLIEADVEPTLAAEAEEELVQVEEEDAGPGAELEEEEEEPVMIVEEETVITSATGITDEEDVLALAEQLDGAESSAEADAMDEGDELSAMEVDAQDQIEEEITSAAFDEEQPEVTTAVDLELNIQQAAQDEQDMINSADGLTSELNDKENAFDAFDAHEAGLTSEDVDDEFMGDAAPGATEGFLFGQRVVSL